jgi:hypothetical protein
MSHKTSQKKPNKKSSTEHAKSAYVTQNKPKNQTKRPQHNMLNKLMSHSKQTKNKQKTNHIQKK